MSFVILKNVIVEEGSGDSIYAWAFLLSWHELRQLSILMDHEMINYGRTQNAQ